MAAREKDTKQRRLWFEKTMRFSCLFQYLFYIHALNIQMSIVVRLRIEDSKITHE